MCLIVSVVRIADQRVRRWDPVPPQSHPGPVDPHRMRAKQPRDALPQGLVLAVPQVGQVLGDHARVRALLEISCREHTGDVARHEQALAVPVVVQRAHSGVVLGAERLAPAGVPDNESVLTVDVPGAILAPGLESAQHQLGVGAGPQRAAARQ